MFPQIALAIAAACLIDNKVKPLGFGKLNPLNSLMPPPTPVENVPHPGAPPDALPGNIPGNIPRNNPGTGVFDGHGTGVSDQLPTLAQAAQQAAAQQAAAQLAAAAAQQAGTKKPTVPTVADAATAAEDMKNRILAAMNTPEGDRSPEQLALLQNLAGLPVLSKQP